MKIIINESDQETKCFPQIFPNKKISLAEAKTFYTVKVFTTVKLPDNNTKGNLLMIKSIEVNISEVRKSLQRLDTAKSFLWRLLQ